LRPLQQPDALVHRARNPIHRTNLIEHRATNPELGVGLELGLTRRIVLIHSVHEADRADRNQIFRVQIGRKTKGKPMGHHTDHMGEFFDDPLTSDFIG